MSATIDERVVEMRFDNKEFEKNAKQTLSTLERLKIALGFSTPIESFNKLDKVVKKIDLADLSAGIEMLNKRFSTFGTFSARMVENVADTIYSKLGAAVNWITNTIVTAGKRRAFNLENAHFQLQALLKDETKVQAIMSDANESVLDTAYGFDEAARAASQFAATGIKQGEEMVKALKGITGVAAMTNSEYQNISQIFTTVAGNGRLMGDQLLQLSTRGLNAAVTISEFFNDVNSGSAQATAETENAIKTLTEGLRVTEADIREFVSGGKISFKMFAEAMGNAFGDSAKRANETFTGAMSNLRAALGRIGAGFYSPLIEQNSELILTINALKSRINDIKKQLVFDESIGNVKALSKQFTDMVLNVSRAARGFIETVDLDKPLQALYWGVETVKSAAKGLWSVIKPLVEAIREVFSAFKMDDVVRLSWQISQVVSELKLSDRAAQNVKDTAVGLLNVVKLLATAFLNLLKFLSPVLKPLTSLGSAFLELSGHMGRTLTTFTDWLRRCSLIANGFNMISNAIKVASKVLASFIDFQVVFLSHILDFMDVGKVLDIVTLAFTVLGRTAIPVMEKIIEVALKFVGILGTLASTAIVISIKTLGDMFQRLWSLIKVIDLSFITNQFKKFIDVVKELTGALQGARGLTGVVEGFKKFFNLLPSVFNVDNVVGAFNKLKTLFGEFLNWYNEKLKPVFSNVKPGNLVAGGAGLAMVYSIIQISKTLNKFANSIHQLPDLLGNVNSAIKAFEKDLKAEAVTKVAKAILILSAALAILSYTNVENLGVAAAALGIIGGLLVSGMAVWYQFADLAERTKQRIEQARLMTIPQALNNLFMGIVGSFRMLIKELKVDFVAHAVKQIAISLGVLITSIIFLARELKSNKAGIEEGLNLLKWISLIFVATFTILAVAIAKCDDLAKGYQKLGTATLQLAASLGVIVLSLNSLFKMKIPNDWPAKSAILVAVLASVGLVAFTINKFSGQVSKSVSIGIPSVLNFGAGLYLAVLALNKLFKISLPHDWLQKTGILIGLMASIGAIAGTLMGIAQDGKVVIKAGGTIVAMCAYLVTAVGSIAVLSLFPLKTIAVSASALTVILVALAAGLYSAGQSANKISAAPILAMTALMGSVVAALAILPLTDWRGMAVAAASMSAVLFMTATTFNNASKVANPASATAVGLMAGIIAAIGASLFAISKYNWTSIAASALSMSSVLAIVSVCFAALNDMKPNGSVVGIIIGTLGLLLTVGNLLIELSAQNWQNLLVAAGALSTTLLALEAACWIASAVGKAAKDALTGLGVLELLLIGLVADFAILGVISKNNWGETVLAGADLMTQICYKLGEMITAIIRGFATSIAQTLPTIGNYISQFAENLNPFVATVKSFDQGVINGITNLVKIFLILGAAEFLNALLGFGVKANGFIKFSADVLAFGALLKTFSKQIEGLDNDAIRAAAAAGQMMAELANRIPPSGVLQTIMGQKSLSIFGTELAAFGPKLAGFADSVKDITEDSVRGAHSVAMMMADLANNLPPFNIWSRVFGSEGKLVDFGEELKAFGKAMDIFADDVKNVTEDKVNGAINIARMLVEISNSLPKASTIFKKSNLKGFADDLILFGLTLNRYSESVKTLDTKKLEKATAALKEILELSPLMKSFDGNAGKRFTKALDDFAKAGINDFCNAFYGASDKISKAVKDLLYQPVRAVNEQVPVYADAGVKLANAYTSAYNVTLSRQSNSMIGNMKSIGVFLGTGLINGLSSTIEKVRTAATLVGTTVISTIQKVTGVHSPSWILEQIGKFCGEGLKNGLDKMKGVVQKAAADLGITIPTTIEEVVDLTGLGELVGDEVGKVKDALTTNLDIDLSDVSNEWYNQGWMTSNSLMNGLMNGFEPEKIDQMYKTLMRMREVAKEAAYEDERMATTFDVKKTTLGLDAAYVASKTAVMMVDERSVLGKKKYNDEMADLLAQANSLQSGSTSSARGAAAQQKQIQQEVITAENEYWAKLLEVKRQGAEAEKYQSMTISEFQNEVLQNTQEILNKYTEQLNSTRETLMGQLGLFDEVAEQEYKSSQELIDNLSDQIQAYDDYTETISSLDQRLEDRELGKYLKTLGVDNLAQLQEINSMSDEQLSAYANLYDEKMYAANRAAEAQLTDLKSETEQNLGAVFGAMYNSVDLADFQGVFDGSLRSINQYVQDIMVPLETAITAASEAAKSIGTGIGSGLESGLNGEEGISLEERINTPLTAAFESVKLGGESTAKDLGSFLGQNIGSGVGEGLTDNSTTGIINKCNEFIKSVDDALKSAGQIHSPSQLTQNDVGKPLAEGVAAGLLLQNQLLQTNATTVVNTIKDQMLLTGKQMETVGKTLSENVTNAITKHQETFKKDGQKSAESFMSGIKNKFDKTFTTGQDLSKQTTKGIENQEHDFEDRGKAGGDSFISGVEFHNDDYTTTGENVVTYLMNGIGDLAGKLYDTAVNAVFGFVGGFRDNIDEAASAAAAMAKAAYEAAMEELEIESPSKKMRWLGDMSGVGYINGLTPYIVKAAETGEDIASSTIKAVEDPLKNISRVVDFGIDTDPIIRPTVDLSDVTRSVSEINAMFNDAVRQTTIKANTAAASMNVGESKNEEASTKKSNEIQPTTIKFEQNNYSPKALSTSEIYRQTRNQISMIKGRLDKI